MLAQTTLRNILGTRTLAGILSEREEIAEEMLKILDEATDPWGKSINSKASTRPLRTSVGGLPVRPYM